MSVVIHINMIQRDICNSFFYYDLFLTNNDIHKWRVDMEKITNNGSSKTEPDISCLYVSHQLILRVPLFYPDRLFCIQPN